jgi:hypothetical protein
MTPDQQALTQRERINTNGQQGDAALQTHRDRSLCTDRTITCQRYKVHFQGRQRDEPV